MDKVDILEVIMAFCWLVGFVSLVVGNLTLALLCWSLPAGFFAGGIIARFYFHGMK